MRSHPYMIKLVLLPFSYPAILKFRVCRKCSLDLHSRFMLRIFFGSLGIVVITEGFRRKGSNTKVCIYC